MFKIDINKTLLKEVLFDVFFFSFLYRLIPFIIKFCDLKLHNVVSKLDLFFPTLTVFVVPYFIFFIFIFVAPYFIGVKDRLLLHRFTTNFLISAIIGFLIFLIYPTYVDRDVFNIKNKILYSIYKYDVGGNACPSFHVLVAWCIWIHFRQLEISKKIKLSVHAAIVIVELVNFLTKKYSLDIKLFNFVETKYFKYLKRTFFFILIIFFILAISFFFVVQFSPECRFGIYFWEICNILK